MPKSKSDKCLGMIPSKCRSIWDIKTNELYLVERGKDMIDSELNSFPSHEELAKAIEEQLHRSLTSKRGNYFERALNIICKSQKHLHLFYTNKLPNKNSDSEKLSKNNCTIYIPRLLSSLIDKTMNEVREKSYSFKDESDVQTILKTLSEETIRLKDYYRYNKPREEDFEEFKLDLDLGLYDEYLDEYYLYEIKSKGHMGVDHISEHILKLLKTYCSIIYNNDVDVNKVHFSWVLVTDVKNRFFCNGKDGFVGLYGFLDRHKIQLSRDEINTIFGDIPKTRDKELEALVKRIMFVFESHPNCANMQSPEYRYPTEFRKLYKSIYYSRFID